MHNLFVNLDRCFIQVFFSFLGFAIQCYQCDSNENSDLCPQEAPFDKEINAMVDCNSFEANVPGQFCVKIYQESPGCKYCTTRPKNKVICHSYRLFLHAQSLIVSKCYF